MEPDNGYNPYDSQRTRKACMDVVEIEGCLVTEEPATDESMRRYLDAEARLALLQQLDPWRGAW
jgi:hypothetical protein